MLEVTWSSPGSSRFMTALDGAQPAGGRSTAALMRDAMDEAMDIANGLLDGMAGAASRPADPVTSAVRRELRPLKWLAGAIGIAVGVLLLQGALAG
ncbi:MAG: hypothetical protein JNK11_12815 [Alphaproteobacteria bacterium]|nr:hypothetical protein [Alphaproteobacteria bacterium]